MVVSEKTQKAKEIKVERTVGSKIQLKAGEISSMCNSFMKSIVKLEAFAAALESKSAELSARDKSNLYEQVFQVLGFYTTMLNTKEFELIDLLVLSPVPAHHAAVPNLRQIGELISSLGSTYVQVNSSSDSDARAKLVIDGSAKFGGYRNEGALGKAAYPGKEDIKMVRGVLLNMKAKLSEYIDAVKRLV